MMEKQRQKLFMEFKPLCVAILKSPDIHLLAKLQEKIVESNPESITPLLDFILFPLIHSANSNRNIESVLKTIDLLLNQIQPNAISETVLTEIYILMPKLFEKSTVRSEELRLYIAGILQNAWRKHQNTFILIQDKFQPLLAHNLHMLLEFLNVKSFNSLRNSVLDGLLILLDQINDKDFAAKILPGTFSSVSKVILNNPNVNHKVVVSSIKVLTKLLVKTIPDTCTNSSPWELFTEAHNLTKTGTSVDSHNTSTFRTKDWLDKTVTNVGQVLRMLIKVKSHLNAEVRMSVLQLCFELICNCRSTLSNCYSLFMDTMLCYLSDESEDLTKLCLEKLLSLAESTETRVHVHGRLQRSLVNVIENISQLSTTVDESLVAEKLSILYGCIKLLDKSCILVLDLHIEEFVTGLINLLEPELKNMKLIKHDSSEYGFDRDIQRKLIGNQSGFPKKQFQRFSNDQSYKIIQELVKLLACIEVPSFVKQLLITLNNSTLQYQTMLLLNEYCAAGDKGGDLVGQIVREYLQLDFLDIPTSTTDFRFKKSILPIQKNVYPTMNIAESSLLVLKNSVWLEGLSLMVNHLDTYQFANVLMDGLYILLEKLGDSNYLISSSAAASLVVFASVSQQPSHRELLYSPVNGQDNLSLEPTISNLIMMHSDYLIDSISHKLRYISLNPIAPRVLVVAIRVAGSEIIGPLMTDCIDQVLDTIDELGTSGYIPQFGPTITDDEDLGLVGELLLVLYTLLEVISNDLSKHEQLQGITETQENIKSAEPDPENLLSGCSSDILSLYLKVKPLETKADEVTMSAEEFFTSRIKDAQDVTENNPPRSEETNDTESAEKEVLTPHQTVAISILQRTVDFLSSDSSRIRVAILRILLLGIPVLYGTQELDPFVHKVWPYVLNRCKDKSHFVVLEAVNVIGVICNNSKEFMRQRIQVDVIDTLFNLLKNLQLDVQKNAKIQSHQSQSKQISNVIYSTGIETRLYLSVLKSVNSIVTHVPLSNALTNDLTLLLFNFLNCRFYAKTINELAKDMLLTIAKTHNRNWLYLLTCLALGMDEYHNVIIPKSLIHKYKPFGSIADYTHTRELFDMCNSDSLATIDQLLDKHSNQQPSR